MQSSSWIERGADGRPRYVRQRSGLPSFRQIVAEAFRDIRSNNPFSLSANTTVSQAQNQSPFEPRATNFTSQTNNRLDTPGLEPTMRNSQASTAHVQGNTGARSIGLPQQSQDQSQSTSQEPQPSSHIPPYPTPFGFPQPYQYTQMNHEGFEHFPTANPSALIHYTAPHPKMYPYVPPGTRAMTCPHVTPQPTVNGVPPQGAPLGFPISTQSATSNVSHMSQAQISANRSPFNQGADKPRCGECGRFRSARYRWKHPTEPGQPVKPNICRRCRKIATDSEEEDDNGREDRRYQHNSHTRHRSRGRTSRPRSRAQSSARVAQYEDFDFYAPRQASRNSSDSGTSKSYRLRREKHQYRRARSSSDEVVRYYDVPIQRPTSRTRRVVYLDSSQDDPYFSSGDKEDETHYTSDPQRGTMVIGSRPSTPSRGLLSSHYLDPRARAPIVIERREYYDEPHPSYQLRRKASNSRFGSMKQYQQSRSNSLDDSSYARDKYTARDIGGYYGVETDGTPRRRLDRNGSRNQSRKRASIDEEAASEPMYHLLYHAPSPPRLRENRPVSTRTNQKKGGENAEDVERDDESDSQSSSRRRSVSISERRGTREEVAPIDDYDWYDKDGMRIRVREI